MAEATFGHGPKSQALEAVFLERGPLVERATAYHLGDGDVSKGLGVLPDQMRVVGRVHEVIQIGDALTTHDRQWDGDLAVMKRG